jgi:hypothetical protein
MIYSWVIYWHCLEYLRYIKVELDSEVDHEWSVGDSLCGDWQFLKCRSLEETRDNETLSKDKQLPAEIRVGDLMNTNVEC